jgi:hypothetical protein
MRLSKEVTLGRGICLPSAKAAVRTRGGKGRRWAWMATAVRTPRKNQAFLIRRFTKKCIRTRHFAESVYGSIQALIKPHPIQIRIQSQGKKTKINTGSGSSYIRFFYFPST